MILSMLHGWQRHTRLFLVPGVMWLLLTAFPILVYAAQFTGKVVAISDGDTISVLRVGKAVKVRLHGVDTPEKAQAFGTQARKFTSDMVFQRDVTVAIRETDRYGRLVGEVLLSDGRSVNQELVKAGMAWWSRRYAPHDTTFAQLEAEARTALDESFRLPAEVADFLHRYVYAHDGIAFHSQNRQRLPAVQGLEGWLSYALAPDHPMILIEHNDDSSQQANACEAVVIEALVQAACVQLQLDVTTGLGIVVPHRAQKALLQARLPHLAGAVDTVERFQGGSGM